MKFSVLMSVYKNDNASYLKEALESIYDSQTSKPDEIVVVFDGPLNDELHSVLYSFREGKESIVKYYPQEINKGLGEALRIGAEKCLGDYIFRMDSDDISVPDRFEKQKIFLFFHSEVDVLGSDISEFNLDPDEPKQSRRVCFEHHNDIVRMSKRRSPMNHVSVCIKRETLLRCGNYIPLRYVEDYYLWARMIHDGATFANINETLVKVRIGNGFAARRSYKEHIKSWKVLQTYMIEKKMISKFDVFLNMLYIRVLIYSPAWFKKIMYKFLLRTK